MDALRRGSACARSVCGAVCLHATARGTRVFQRHAGALCPAWGMLCGRTAARRHARVSSHGAPFTSSFCITLNSAAAAHRHGPPGEKEGARALPLPPLPRRDRAAAAIPCHPCHPRQGQPGCRPALRPAAPRLLRPRTGGPLPVPAERSGAGPGLRGAGGRAAVPGPGAPPGRASPSRRPSPAPAREPIAALPSPSVSRR